MLPFAPSAMLRTSGLEASVWLLDFCLSSSIGACALLSAVAASSTKSLSALLHFGASVLDLSANPGLLGKYQNL